MENKKYICPVCGYDRLNEAPYGEDYKKNFNPSGEICSNCNCEFGFDLEPGGATKDGFTIEEYRNKHLCSPRRKKYLKNLENEEMQNLIEWLDDKVIRHKS